MEKEKIETVEAGLQEDEIEIQELEDGELEDAAGGLGDEVDPAAVGGGCNENCSC